MIKKYNYLYIMSYKQKFLFHKYILGLANPNDDIKYEINHISDIKIK